MRVRDLTTAEYEILISDRPAPDGTKYKYLLPNSRFVEVGLMVESDSGAPIATAIAVRVPEILLIMEKEFHPNVKEMAIAQIHGVMRSRLQEKGYTMAFAVVPPFLQAYVRRMIKKFNWKRDYPAYRIG